VHDIVDLEGRGIPGVFVASSEFVAAAEAQSAALGVEPHRVFVAHPIQDRTDAEMMTLADQAVAALIDAVTTGSSTTR
jgi:hypothetical protein